MFILILLQLHRFLHCSSLLRKENMKISVASECLLPTDGKVQCRRAHCIQDQQCVSLLSDIAIGWSGKSFQDPHLFPIGMDLRSGDQ